MPETLGQDLNNNQYVKLGVVGVSVAAEDTAYTAAGWEDLGVMEPGSFQCDFPKEYFKLQVGFPRATKMQAVIATDGTLGFNLHELTQKALEVATNSGAATFTYATAPASTTVASSPTVNGCTLTSGTGYAKGQMVEITVASNGKKYVTYLDSVAGAVVTWKPALPVAPAASDVVKAVKSISRALGTSQVTRMAIKAVFVDQWGEKVTLYCPAVSCAQGFQVNIPDGSNAKLPMSFQAYGKDQTWNGKTEQVVGYIYNDLAGVT